MLDNLLTDEQCHLRLEQIIQASARYYQEVAAIVTSLVPMVQHIDPKAAHATRVVILSDEESSANKSYEHEKKVTKSFSEHTPSYQQPPSYASSAPYGAGQPGYGGAPPSYGGQPGYGGAPPAYGGQPGYGGAPPAYGGQPGYGAPATGGPGPQGLAPPGLPGRPGPAPPRRPGGEQGKL